MNVCIVTNELRDFPVSGGIGTANQNLAFRLAEFGYCVHIAYVGNVSERQRAHFKNKFYFTVHGVESENISHPTNSPYLIAPLYVYNWFLKTSLHFDVVIFNDYLAYGYYCFINKPSIPSIAGARLGVISHSSTAWCDELNGMTSLNAQRLCLHEMERACLELADFLLAPSQYLVDWMDARGWRLPEDRAVIPYVMLPESGTWGDLPPGRPIDGLREIVFFGRLETRKGLDCFLQSLALLPPGLLADREVTFLGWDGPTPRPVIEQRLAELSLPADKTRFITDFDATRARAYLREHAALAVMPSPGDNSPCVIYECLADRTPFIASTMGGQAELIHPEDHEFCLAQPYPHALAALLTHRLARNDARPARPSQGLVNALDNTLAYIKRQACLAAPAAINQQASTPLVSIVIPTHNRPDLLARSVRSALAQDYPEVEVLIVDDGSDDPAVQPRLQELQALDPRVRVIRQENKYLGAARNTGVRHARGDLLVFLDDDNLLDVDYVTRCHACMEATGADAVVPAMRMFDSRTGCTVYEYYPLGSTGFTWQGVQFLLNVYGDACGLVKKSWCARLPFLEVYQSTHEDWHFWARLSAADARIVPLPILLFSYRVSVQSMIRTTPHIVNFHNHAAGCAAGLGGELIALAEAVYFTGVMQP